MPTYKNKTDQELVIPNVGTVAPGGTISSQNKLENSNLEEINSEPSEPNKEVEE